MCYESRVRFETRVRVRVQVWDSAIFKKVGCGCDGTRRLNKYYKYFYLCFLYIFTIKIFLKNTLLCPDSQNKERRISAVPATFKADFGLFRPFPACFDRIVRRSIRSDMADTARFWPNQPGSMRIEPHQRESKKKKKKKKLKRGTDARATTSDAVSRVGPCRTQVQHPPSRVRAF